MSRSFDAPETTDTGGGNFLREPGTYHLVATSVEDPATNKSGGVLDGFKVNFQVLAGTVEDQAGKTIDTIFWDPKLTDKNEGLFARQQQAACFIALGLMHPKDLGKPGLEIELEKAKGRQCVATFEVDEKSEKGYLRLHFCDIWHVDDPQAKKFPKDEKSLTLIPASLRLKAEDFKQKKGGDDEGDAGKPVPVGGPPSDDLGDL